MGGLMQGGDEMLAQGVRAGAPPQDAQFHYSYSI